MIGPLRGIEQELGEEHAKAVTEWRKANTQHELVMAEWKREAKAALKAGEEPPEQPADGPTGPVRDRLATSDATV
ncbi:MAG: YfjI family protein [Mangrovicoccus sp.]|nr:YfjI family protein [Mangrovicoccus sp.]